MKPLCETTLTRACDLPGVSVSASTSANNDIAIDLTNEGGRRAQSASAPFDDSFGTRI